MMVCYGGGHVNIIEPLYQALKHDHSVTILALTLAAPYLERKNIPHVTFRNFSHLYPESVVRYGEKLVTNLPSNSEVKYEDSLYYMGCSYNDLVVEHGEQVATELYNKKGRAAFYPEATLNKIMHDIKPDIVIATNSIRAERASLSAATKLSIPTLCVNDTVWVEDTLSGVLDVANDGLANTICVLSEETKHELEIKRTNDSAKIVVTGTPVFDTAKRTERNKIDSRVSILYADCHLPESLPNYPDVKGDPLFAERVRYELNRLAKIHDWRVTFRMHPNQEVDYSSFENVVVSERHDSLYDSLAQADLVITNISTVGLEGKAMGLGLVSLEGTVYNIFNSFFEVGLSTPIYSETDLYESIVSELKTNAGSSSLYDGFAVDNIVLEIDALLGGNA